jgi:hypothetical protein
LVRSFLNGRFENTAFCLLAPDGKKRLTGSSRSPKMVLRTPVSRTFPEYENDEIIDEMVRIAKPFKTTDNKNTPLVQDFHSFRQALNVASGDQRLLLFVVGNAAQQAVLRESLRPVLADPEITGRFHIDFADEKTDAAWAKSVRDIKSETGLFILQADSFGMEGKTLAQLPHDASAAEIKSALSESNAAFAKTETRKVYSEHVAKGRRKDVYFKGGMPYGEDRNGDGKIDHR